MALMATINLKSQRPVLNDLTARLATAKNTHRDGPQMMMTQQPSQVLRPEILKPSSLSASCFKHGENIAAHDKLAPRDMETLRGPLPSSHIFSNNHKRIHTYADNFSGKFTQSISSLKPMRQVNQTIRRRIISHKRALVGSTQHQTHDSSRSSTIEPAELYGQTGPPS